MTLSSAPRLAYIGGTPRGLRVLEALVELDLVPVCMWIMQEDGHEQRRASEDLAGRAEQLGVPYRLARRMGSDDPATLAAAQADLLLAVGWRTIIPREVYATPRFGAVLIHDSLLPRYRGFAPTNWAIINGEREAGATLLHMADGVDQGDIIGQVRIPIGPRTTAPELYDDVIDATVDLVRSHLTDVIRGCGPRRAQDESMASYACARTPEDGRIDWGWRTDRIDRLVRGLTYPYPGAWTSHNGRRLFVWDAEPLDPAPCYEGRITGRVVRSAGGSIDVLTADGVMRVHRAGYEPDEQRAADDLVRSVRCRLGSDDAALAASPDHP